jgi:hypothetical protein
MLEWTLIETLLNGDAYLIWKQENGLNYKYFNFCCDTPKQILNVVFYAFLKFQVEPTPCISIQYIIYEIFAELSQVL